MKLPMCLNDCSGYMTMPFHYHCFSSIKQLEAFEDDVGHFFVVVKNGDVRPSGYSHEIPITVDLYIKQSYKSFKMIM